MSKIDSLMKRLKDVGRQKGRELVSMTGRYEVMTSTQACRYQQLRDPAFNRPAKKPARPKDKPYYTLDEASQRLAIPVEQLLAAAATGELRCFLGTSGWRGQWRQDLPPGKPPAHLAVPVESCSDIANYGSTNVHFLQHFRDDGHCYDFQLQDVQWLDSSALLLKHPLRLQ